MAAAECEIVRGLTHRLRRHKSPHRTSLLTRANYTNENSEIDDYTQEWTFEDNSFDYVHLRWLVGTIEDWAELFRQAYRVLKPGGFIETFECNGFYQSDDGTMTDDTHLSRWGYFFREGALAIGSKASFSVVQDGLQVKGLEEAGFTRITENHIKVVLSPPPSPEPHALWRSGCRMGHHLPCKIADADPVDSNFGMGQGP